MSNCNNPDCKICIVVNQIKNMDSIIDDLDVMTKEHNSEKLNNLYDKVINHREYFMSLLEHTENVEMDVEYNNALLNKKWVYTRTVMYDRYGWVSKNEYDKLLVLSKHMIEKLKENNGCINKIKMYERMIENIEKDVYDDSKTN